MSTTVAQNRPNLQAIIAYAEWSQRRPALAPAGNALDFPFSSSGNLAKLTAMRRASSRVSSLAGERRPGSFLEIELPERLPGAVADDEAGVVCLLDRPGRREAAHGSDDSGWTH